VWVQSTQYKDLRCRRKRRPKLTGFYNGSGEERLIALLKDLFRSNPEKARDSILSAVRTFLGNTGPQDDLTCVVARFASMGLANRDPVEAASAAGRKELEHQDASVPVRPTA
jgi:hypothetical protein